MFGDDLRGMRGLAGYISPLHALFGIFFCLFFESEHSISRDTPHTPQRSSEFDTPLVHLGMSIEKHRKALIADHAAFPGS